MGIALGKYQIVDSITPRPRWNKNDKKTFLVIILVFICGLGLAYSRLFDNLFPKEIQYFFAIGLPIMFIFIQFLITENRKPFITTGQNLFLYPDRLIIKSETRKEIFVKELIRIDFSYNGDDGGFFHPIFNSKRNRGNLNILSVDLNNETIKFELYMPKKTDKTRLDNIIKKYKRLIESQK